MKLPIPEEQRSRTLSNIVTIAVGLLMYALVLSFKSIFAGVLRGLEVLTPFLIGIAISFLLNPLVVKLDHFQKQIYCRKRDHLKLRRAISTVIAVLLLITLIVAFFSIALPQMITSGRQIISLLNTFINNNASAINDLLGRYDFLHFDGQSLNFDWDTILSTATQYIDVGINYLISISTGVYTVIFQALMGLITCIYILLDKEHLCAQGKKLAYAFLPKESAESMIFWTRRAGRIFSGFFAGKVFDSIIIGLLCYIGMIIMGLEYPLIISFIIGLTNIIPFFGPFIGAVPSALILVIINPWHALYFVIFTFVLQQLDGNVIGPLILGDSVGLQPLWIMTAIMAGGKLFGVLGMLLSVPIFALIYAIVRAIAEYRLKKNGMETRTDYYLTHPEVQEEEHVPKRIFRRNKKSARK